MSRTRATHVRRLWVTFIAVALGFFLIDARVTALDIPGIDAALEIGFVSLLFTMFAVGGFAHAMNIVDGTNGLAGFAALIVGSRSSARASVRNSLTGRKGNSALADYFQPRKADQDHCGECSGAKKG